MLIGRAVIPILFSLYSRGANAFVPAHHVGIRRTQFSSLFDAATSEIASMRAGEIKKELESYGISTASFLEKSELVAALEKARADGLKPNAEKKKKKRPTGGDATSSNAQPTDERPREERLKEELENCRQMKAGELKKELEELGVSTKSFFEKSEFAQALAEARVDGVEKKTEEGYAEYAEVEVLTDDNSGPRKKQSSQSQEATRQSPFGGGSSPFGGAGMGANPFGGAAGMGGMGGIADILKNMGGGAGAGANPFAGMGGMGGMGDAMGKAQEMMKNPKVMEIMIKAQKNPKIMKAMQECMGNPAAFAKYQNDPEVGELMRELQKYM